MDHTVEPFKGAALPARRQPWDGPITGGTSRYEEMPFDQHTSWGMLPASTRAWAEQVAGPPIPDPFTTDASHRYWHCKVQRAAEATPSPGQWSYTCWMVGMAGLAVAVGTATATDESGWPTRWRASRWALPIDGSQVRRLPLTAAAPPVGDDQEQTVAAVGGGKARAASAPRPRALDFVPVGIAPYFGNLPADIQRHLLEPFITGDRQPQRADLYATVNPEGALYVERYTCYFFNASWVSFGEAMRWVDYTSGLQGPPLWNDSPESKAIRRAPWRAAAWYAPVARPSNNLDTILP